MSNLTDFRRIARAYLDADPVKRLAVGVLSRAFNDYGKVRYVQPFTRIYIYRDEITTWVAETGGDFDFWCDIADIRAEVVRGWFDTKLQLLTRYGSVDAEQARTEIELDVDDADLAPVPVPVLLEESTHG